MVPWKLTTNSSPVDITNRDEWTKFHRRLAEKRYVPKDLDDLQQKVSTWLLGWPPLVFTCV
jgi:hypothetical protein